MSITQNKNFADCLPAVTGALGADKAFALVAMEDAENPEFFCGAPVGDRCFMAVSWASTFSSALMIGREYTARQAAALAPVTTRRPITLDDVSTDRTCYLTKVGSLITELKESGGKTVISKVIVDDAPRDVIRQSLEFLDDAAGDCMRCLFFVPGEGLWLFVSPEKLINVSRQSDGRSRFSTMSLAGTRAAGTSADIPWDAKNLDEQQMVTDFILRVLADNGAIVENCDSGTRTAAAVQHIVTYIDGYVRSGNIEKLIDALSPTPALCGLPRETSLHRIHNIEDHSRRYYGGYAGIADGQNLNLSVILRCARIADGRCCIYSGSGVTAKSVPETEWDELSLKALPLVRMFSGQSQLNYCQS